MRAAVTVALAVALGVGVWWLRIPDVVPVPAGTDVGTVADAHPGAVLVLEPGQHGPFTLSTRVTVRGEEGARVAGPVTVLADGVRLHDLEIVGGREGIRVVDVDGVRIDRVTVRDADLQGIEVDRSSAMLRDCRVEGMRSPWSQGIIIRNNNGREISRVERCSVEGARSGIVLHVSRAEIRGNDVRDIGVRGIAIMEMSEAKVADNRVIGGRGAGLYCGDVSFCSFTGNEVADFVPDGTGFASHGGQAAVAWYYSAMFLDGNRFTVETDEPIGLFQGSTLLDAPPIFYVWPSGWRGALPAIPIAVLAIVGIYLVRATVGAAHRRRRAQRHPARVEAGRIALGAGLGLFAVQSGHMVEHVVQVWQVYVASTEVRSGFLGQQIDTEPFHFAYNAAVLALLALIAWHVRGSGGSFAPGGRGHAWLTATILVQGYHVVEHVAKMIQYWGRGIDPAPGVLGGELGLVWFHAGINLAVYVGTVVVAVELVRALRAGDPEQSPTCPRTHEPAGILDEATREVDTR